MTLEKREELRQKLRDTFQEVRSDSTRYGYQTRLVVDPESLQELLEKMVDAIPMDLTPEDFGF